MQNRIEKRTVRLFISYKTGPDEGLTSQANSLKHRLEDSGYDVWMDDELEYGLEWNKQIYEQIPQCDILLLLVSEQSANSIWVRREVDVAKGAKVHIIPLLIRTVANIADVLQEFDLRNIQTLDYRRSTQHEFKSLLETIEEQKGRSFKEQEKWLEALKRRHALKRTLIQPSNQEYAVYGLNGANQNCRLILATGNIVDMKDIDVFVNTENDYMQMARCFESTTVSSMLRYQGSLIDENELRDDTVQDELNLMVTTRFGRRPIPEGVIIVTSSGHPDSELCRENNAYYIFHAATVAVTGYGTQRQMNPIALPVVKECVKRLLKRVIPDVDNKKGVISPENTPQRLKQEQRTESGYVPIRSVIFPLFGTGHAKRPTDEAADSMIEGFAEFIHETPNTNIEKIYLCIHYHEELAIVEAVLNQKGFTKLR